MNSNHAYLIFSIQLMRYAITASAVQEIFFLPELTPVPSAPNDLVGLINVRGELIPIIDLSIRLGYPPTRYSVLDRVILLKFNNIRIGIIVNEVYEVQAIATDTIKTELAYHLQQEFNSVHNSYYIQGIAQVDEYLVIILNPDTLIQYISHSLQDVNLEKAESHLEENQQQQFTEFSTKFNFKTQQNFVFCPEATPEERALFQERAKNLRRSLENQDFVGYGATLWSLWRWACCPTPSPFCVPTSFLNSTAKSGLTRWCGSVYC